MLAGTLESRPTAHLGFDASTDARPVGVWLQLDADVFVVRAEHETRLVVALRHHLRAKQGHHMKLNTCKAMLYTCDHFNKLTSIACVKTGSRQ